MIQEIHDEILSDLPKYTIRDKTGNVVTDDADIALKTPVIQEGTPINRALIRNIQGDLYTQDRYNVPRAGWLETDIYETTYSNNIFPSSSSWIKENDNSYYSGDIKLTTSSTNGHYAPDAFTTDSYWISASSTQAWIQVQFPQGVKITKMMIGMGTGSSAQTTTKKILGSKNGQDWIELYSTSGNVDMSSSVRTLSNVDYYSYYKVTFTHSSSFSVRVFDWRVTQYKEKGVNGYELDLPLTSYEKGKIINIEGVTYNGITSFSDLYLNINNLGIKPVNGTIKSGEKYTLVYNGSSWDMVGLKTIIGSFTVAGNSVLQTVNLPFEPDLVICYGEENNYQAVAGGGGSEAGYKHVPRILTKAYKDTNAYGQIVPAGFTYKANQVIQVYYVAIKF